MAGKTLKRPEGHAPKAMPTRTPPQKTLCFRLSICDPPSYNSKGWIMRNCFQLPRPADQGEKRSISPRWIGLIIALALGQLLFVQARLSWTYYWLLKDGQQGRAVITKELWSGHNGVGYKYTVNQKEYTGKSARNWQDAKYKNVQVGNESVVYYSASHPWLSLLYQPTSVVEGLPVLLLVLVFEVFAVVTVIKPRSGWAFSLSDKNENHAS